MDSPVFKNKTLTKTAGGLVFQPLISRAVCTPRVPGVPHSLASLCSSFSTSSTKAGKCWSKRQRRMKVPSSRALQAGCCSAGGNSGRCRSTHCQWKVGKGPWPGTQGHGHSPALLDAAGTRSCLGLMLLECYQSAGISVWELFSDAQVRFQCSFYTLSNAPVIISVGNGPWKCQIPGCCGFLLGIHSVTSVHSL